MMDTTPTVQAEYRALIMARSPQERFLMAIGMFDTARAFVLASLPQGLPLDEVRRLLAERFYGDIPADCLPVELQRK